MGEVALPTPSDAPPNPNPPHPERSTLGDVLISLGGTAAIGVGNYGFTLAAAWVLDPSAFSVVASVSSLLVVVGTVSTAAVPWYVAQQAVRHPEGSEARSGALRAAFASAVLLGVAAAAVVVALAWVYAPAGVLAALGVATLALFAAAPGMGLLQGTGRFGTLAALGVAEVAVKLGGGTALAAAGFGAAGAIAGVAAGAALVAGYGVALVARDLRPVLPLPRGHRVVRTMGGIGAIQVAVAVLSSLDVVVASLLRGGTAALARYQLMLVLARVPLFVSTAVSAVAFRQYNASPQRSKVVGQTTALFLLPCWLTAATAATVPTSLLCLVFPASYPAAAGLLPPLALAGGAVATVNMATTFLQSDGLVAPTLRRLALPMMILAPLYGLLSGDLGALAWAAAAGDLAVAAAVVVLVAGRHPAAHLGRRFAVISAGGGAWWLVAWAARPAPAVWVAVVVAAGAALTTVLARSGLVEGELR